MESQNKNVSFRLSSDLDQALKTFMDSTRDKDVEAALGKNAISRSKIKAVKYLLKSFFDQRSITNRGLFDRCLIDLVDLTKDLRQKGHVLNDLNKDYFSGQQPGHDRLDLLKEIKSLVEKNFQIIETYSSSYKLEPDK